MNTPQLFSANRRVIRQWRNGGGTTQEIAVFPEGAGDNDFIWRASLATIAEPGAFSLWPGVDRLFTVVEGMVQLSIGGVERTIGSGDPPIAFAGEAEVWGEPVGGTAIALNIMTARGRGQGGRLCLLLARRRVSVTVGGRQFDLEKDDALLTATGDLPQIDAADGLVVEIEA